MIEIINRVLRCINQTKEKLFSGPKFIICTFNVLSVLMFAPFIALLTNQKIILKVKYLEFLMV